MYKPKLRYSFCVMRPRSLWSQLSLMRYLNSFEIVPYLSWDKQHIETAKGLKKSGVIFKQRKAGDGQLDYDVVFSESSGVSKFEKRTLEDSKRQGKINIKINNSISINKNLVNKYYVPEKTKDTLHGIFLKGQRTVNHFKKFTGDLFLLNGGDPDWDQFNTDEFKTQVKEVQNKYRDKFLLIGLSLHHKEEGIWCEEIIAQANKRKMRVVICIHPGVEHLIEKFLNKPIQKHIDHSTPRYVLFASASHIIANISSSMIAEGLYFGKKVGCNSSIVNFIKYGKPHLWVEDHQEWIEHIIPKVGKYACKNIPRINTNEEIDKFLSTDLSFMNQNEVDSFFGWKRVSSYCEHLFQEVERQCL